MLEFIQSIDMAVLFFIQEYIRIPALDPMMLLCSLIGNAGALWLVMSVVMLMRPKYRITGFVLLLSLALGFLLNNILLKNIVERPRPFETLTELNAYRGAFADSSSWSFPSGHTCSSFAAAFILTAQFKNGGGYSYIPAVLISFSRAYIGVHFPSDIIAGAVIGTLCAFIVLRFFFGFSSLSKKRC